MANSNEGQDHKDKYFDTSRKILSQEMAMYNMEAFSILSLRRYDQCQFFLKLVKCQGEKIKYLQKDLIIRDIHVKYQSSSTHYSKVISKNKFIKKGHTLRSRSQGKKLWYQRIGLITRNTHVKYQSSSTQLFKSY